MCQDGKNIQLISVITLKSKDIQWNKLAIFNTEITYHLIFWTQETYLVNIHCTSVNKVCIKLGYMCVRMYDCYVLWNVCMYVYVCMYVCMCTYVCMYVCMCVYVCTYVCMYECMYVCICMYCVYMYVCMCIRMYVCIYVRMYVRMYVCTYSKTVETWQLSSLRALPFETHQVLATCVIWIMLNRSQNVINIHIL
jgi:nuclear pore complex protein Nup62